MSPEFLLSLAGAILGVIFWFARLESKVSANKDQISDLRKLLEKGDARMERLEIKHDQVYTEVRTVLLSIQKSISNIEGRLSINSKGD